MHESQYQLPWRKTRSLLAHVLEGMNDESGLEMTMLYQTLDFT